MCNDKSWPMYTLLDITPNNPPTAGNTEFLKYALSSIINLFKNLSTSSVIGDAQCIRCWI